MSPEFERLIGRAVGDKKFREEVLNDPEGVAKSFGLSDAETEQLKAGIAEVSQKKSTGDIDDFFQLSGGRWV